MSAGKTNYKNVVQANKKQSSLSWYTPFLKLKRIRRSLKICGFVSGSVLVCHWCGLELEQRTHTNDKYVLDWSGGL